MRTKVTYKSNHRLVIRKGQDAAEVVGKRFGAYVMTTAKRSIRSGGKKGKTSEAGQPPRSQTGTLKRFIRFAYDSSERATFIGPVLLPGRVGKDSPEALEKGGTSTVEVREDGKRRRRRQRIEARPYMVPALEKRIGELPGLWSGAIRN